MSEPKERMAKYWICDDCVKAKHPDWVTAYPNGGNTLVLALCGHCEREDIAGLTPVVDFKRPGKAPPVWD